ncbi:MAG TPA: FAD-binding oxidoreductase [Microlunatus sp.]|nr:FAD-binding oxidoreductase [Microlunatus sp.]
MIITEAGTSPRRLTRLRGAVRGPVLLPSEPGYQPAVGGWNLNAVQRPAVVVQPVDAADVQAAVRWAGDHGLGVAVQATGHGSGRSCDGGLLLDTSRLGHFQLDPDRRRARVEAGVIWRDLVASAAPYGLAGLPGSSTTVGVVGYTLGGGFGWLGRRFGLSAHAVHAAELVTADGRLRTISRTRHPELFWAVPGGLSGLGVVTRLDIGLHPVPTVYAGNLYHRHDRLPDLLHFFADWSRTAPDELTAAVTVRRFPPTAAVPAPLRGQVLVALRGAYSGDVRRGARLIDRARSALGPAELDTFTALPTGRLAEVSADPVAPLPARSHHELLTDLSPATIEELVALAGVDSDWPLVMTEVRQLGGALRGDAETLSPMAHTVARFSLNAIGVTAGPEQDGIVRQHLATVARRMARHATGDSYLNFLDLDGATPERVRAAFTTADRHRLAALKNQYDPTDVFRFGRRLTKEH